VVKHRIYPFRGVIFDVDPVFANTEEWLASIPIRIEGPWSVAHWRH
jgi:heat shock protein HspQ